MRQPPRGIRSLERKLSTSTSTSTSTTKTSFYRPLDTLPDAGIERFRGQCFISERPALLPRQEFRDIPAVGRWFRHGGLATEYLETHGGEALVPLELTQGAASESTFQRLNAPLSLFLQWMQTGQGQGQGQSLYLAQCQLDDLPAVLRDDFPVPQLVAHAGRGDIYNTSVWIGLPPTYTPLHRDPNPNLFVQLVGEKVVRLVSPDDGLGLFGAVRRQLGKAGGHGSAVFRGDEMMQGEERGLLEEVVWGAGTTGTTGADAGAGAPEGYEARLGPGDGLFIPKGWWHSIKGVGEGVTASVCFLISLTRKYTGFQLICRSIGGFDDSLLESAGKGLAFITTVNDLHFLLHHDDDHTNRRTRQTTTCACDCLVLYSH